MESYLEYIKWKLQVIKQYVKCCSINTKKMIDKFLEDLNCIANIYSPQHSKIISHIFMVRICMVPWN